MKKIICFILGALLGLFAFAACGGDDNNPEYRPAPVYYDITYSAVLDGTKQDVPQTAWKENGAYPKQYERGKETKVDNLKAYYDASTDTQNVKVLFQGWFTDEACTQAFEGITSKTRNALTLYAKLTTETEPIEYTISYYVISEDGAVKSLAEWEVLKAQNGEYPTAYVCGAVTTVDALQNVPNGENKRYSVSAWYTEEACENEFAGITVETTGNIALYATVKVQSVCTINYQIVTEGGAMDVPDDLWLTGKSYPKYYWEGDSVEISALKETYYPDRNTDWEFVGWYYDEECTQPVGGAISKECTGNITLYGKIVTSFWTDPV